MNNLSRFQRHSCSALPAVNSSSNVSGDCSGSRDNGDKTDRPFRRRRTTSFVKLSQFLHTGNVGCTGSIQSALQDLSTTGKLMTKIAESQRRGMESLAIWAHSAGNAAIDDVVQQSRQLYEMFTDKELEFVRQYTHYVQQLQKIADAERAVKDAEENVMNLEEKEKKLKREIEKGGSFFKHRRGGDIYLLNQKLEETRASRGRAEQILSDLRAEMEVVKMFRFRNGMQGIADAYQDFARSCQSIFNCQREIIEMVPAVSNQDVRHMIYRGSTLTRNRVENLRRSLQYELTMSENNSWSSAAISAPKRRSEPRHHVYKSPNDSPPPPYTSAAASINMVLPEYQTGTTDCQRDSAEIQTCSHCGQSVQ